MPTRKPHENAVHLASFGRLEESIGIGNDTLVNMLFDDNPAYLYKFAITTVFVFSYLTRPCIHYCVFAIVGSSEILTTQQRQQVHLTQMVPLHRY